MSAKKTHGLGKGMGSLLGNFDFDITPDVVAKPNLSTKSSQIIIASS